MQANHHMLTIAIKEAANIVGTVSTTMCVKLGLLIKLNSFPYKLKECSNKRIY